MLKKFRPSKYISYVYFFLPILFTFMLFFKEDDIWFLLSHGRYVIGNGIPISEILSMHSNFSFIMQQWLSSVIFYLFYRILGSLGLYLLVFIINFIILYFIYKTCMIISSGKTFSSVITSCFIDICLLLNYIIPRPQIFSLLLFIFLIYSLENYNKGRDKYIYFLPLISILLINFHGAMWLCFFVFCMPYFVEYLYLYIKEKNRKIIKLTIFIFISVISGLLNPYGISLMTYSLKSYGVSYINKVVGEMASFNLAGENFVYAYSYLLLFLFLIFLIFFILDKKRRMTIHEFFLLFGTLYMALCNIRNISLFLVCGFIFICKYINITDRNSKIVPKKLYILLIVVLISVFLYNVFNNNYLLENGNKEIADYLDKNASKSIRLYTNFNDGSYYEFRNYKPYIDSRAEVYLKVNNKSDDVFLEYYDLINGNLDVDKFIKKYNFNYFVVSKNEYFNKYLSSNDNYELILSINDRNLYKAKSN